MSYEEIRIDDEEVLFLGYKYGLALIITNDSVYLPAKSKNIAVTPFDLNKHPISYVVDVSFKKLTPYPHYVLAAIMILIGVFCCYWSLALEYSAKGIGFSLAVLAGGIVLPFCVRNWFSIYIYATDRVLYWKPPIVVNPRQHKGVRWVQTQILNAFSEAGVPVSNVRSGAA